MLVRWVFVIFSRKGGGEIPHIPSNLCLRVVEMNTIGDTGLYDVGSFARIFSLRRCGSECQIQHISKPKLAPLAIRTKQVPVQ